MLGGERVLSEGAGCSAGSGVLVERGARRGRGEVIGESGVHGGERVVDEGAVLDASCRGLFWEVRGEKGEDQYHPGKEGG